MQKTNKKLLTMLLLFAMLIVMALPVQAAKSVKATKDYKKAPAVGMGTTLVKVKLSKAESVYTKFTAPQSGTYKITVSNLKSVPAQYSDIGYGHAYFYRINGYGYLDPQTVATQGGKTESMSTTTKYCYNKYEKKNGVTARGYLASRYGKLYINAGETLYLYNYFTSKAYTYNLKIQRVK